jgi:sugar O-acyltransferase (sialic acid O-acetyltransferase NeuD family)
MSNKLIIFGISKYTELIEHYFTQYTDYRVCGYTVNRAYLTEESYNGKPVVAFEEVERHFPPEEYQAFIAVGLTDINRARKNLFLEFEAKGYGFPTFIHPQALVDPTAKVGRHCIVMEGVVIQAFCDVGDNIIFFPSCALTHHSVMESHSFMSTGVYVGGCSHIGEESFLGLGSIVNSSLTVGRSSFISAGSVISEDIPDNTMFLRNGKTEKLTPVSRKLLSNIIRRH